MNKLLSGTCFPTLDGCSASPPLHAQHAEYEGPVRVLTWSGLGRTVVTWCPRHGILYQVRVGAGWEGCGGRVANFQPAPAPLSAADLYRESGNLHKGDLKVVPYLLSSL